MNSQTHEHIQKLSSLGVYLNKSWIDFVKSKDFRSFDDLLNEFLFTDIEQTTEPNYFLIENIQKPQCFITTPMIIQIDEIIDVSLSDKDRLYNNKSQNPTLKMLVNSGGFKTSGIIQDQIQNLDLDIEPGLKILVKSGAYLIYGVLMICEDNTIVLGGSSPKLIEKRDKMAKLQPRNAAFQNIEEVFDVIPDINFGINPSFIFQDFVTKRNAKNSKTILQTPLQMAHQEQVKTEETIQSTQKSKVENPIKHSIILEQNANMPTFRPTKQMKPSNTNQEQPKKTPPTQLHSPNLTTKMDQSVKSNQISITKSDLPVTSNQVSKTKVPPKQTQTSKLQLNLPAAPIQTSISPSIPNTKPEVPEPVHQPTIIELIRLYDMPRSKTESTYLVNAHFKHLSVNNDNSIPKEKKKMCPFIVTLESNINRQKIDISIDPHFLQQLFDLDYIDKLSPEDLAGTARLCEQKIKEIINSPLYVIDKGRGKPSDRFLLAKQT